MATMPKEETAATAVVASLPSIAQHPYSAIALSPNGQFAIVAGKDNLRLIRISPKGISEVRAFSVSHYFQSKQQPQQQQQQQPNQGRYGYGDVRNTFGGLQSGSEQTPPRPTHNTNVTITSLAWSNWPTPRIPSPNGNENGEDVSESTKTEKPFIKQPDQQQSIAVAASNGVVVVWKASFFLDGAAQGSSQQQHAGSAQPEAILSQHSRSVNSLDWHPTKPGLLLTASQDSTVKLWERKEFKAPRPGAPPTTPAPATMPRTGTHANGEPWNNLGWWFGNKDRMSMNDITYSWQCNATFERNKEAIREVQWSKFQEDVFAIVTVSGSLIVYSIHVRARAIVFIAAHTGEATSLDWHPTRPYVIATGGSEDRCIKVWNLEKSLNWSSSSDVNIQLNAGSTNTNRSTMSVSSSTSTESGSGYLNTMNSTTSYFQQMNSLSMSGSIMNKAETLHVLSTSGSVTKLSWRPSANDTANSDEEADRHDPMLAVATARLTSAGGSGVISLWSYHRPFMPLSVVEGHTGGAVTDFVWIDTPRAHHIGRDLRSQNHQDRSVDAVRNRMSHREMGSVEDEKESRSSVRENSDSTFLWQHVLSVGRDGRCCLQSLARGDRPLSRVSESCFALANLSPFQPGYGSLQIFSVNQQLPKGNDFPWTGLRCDEYTAKAPGVFQELPQPDEDDQPEEKSDWAAGKRLPDTIPDLVFNVIDQGELGPNSRPVTEQDENVVIAPEVVHLSRFAASYRLYPDEQLPTRIGLCLNNADVAESLMCTALAEMWRYIAMLLEGCGIDELPEFLTSEPIVQVMEYTVLPIIRSLLVERAEAGDVQTCVAICEVLQVVHSDQQTRIPGLELNLVREWYLSYIELLQQMCLFSAATDIIRHSKDSFIAARNQQSTTIHESCPRCRKPVMNNGTGEGSGLSACKNCRRRVGMCFLCHQPVKGMFVWCPGCGHGGHLEHALQWFGGLSGNPVREVCPTGCGHKCNLSQVLSGFPRNEPLVCVPTNDFSTPSPSR